MPPTSGRPPLGTSIAHLHPARDADLVSVATVILSTGHAVAQGIMLAGQAGDDWVLDRHLSLVDWRDLLAAQLWASVHDEAWLDRVIQGEMDRRSAGRGAAA